jgi:TPR repeat protein
VEKDEKEAAKWITKSAEQGDAKAQYSLGVYYLSGFGVEKDEKEAVKWLTKSAEQGNAHARKVLEENSGRAEAYSAEIVRRAQAGDAEAQFLVGNGYYYGSHGLTINYKEAVKWLAKSAEQGCTKARLTLGVCYYDGKGVAKNEKEALKCWIKAADEGDVRAQVELGLLYETGKGVTQDYKEAVKWYTKAAEQGDERAKKALELLKSK